ncbi:MAG: parallel beta-helix domain-containing protein [Candidatus Neomarinimicrobiota bacterium]
MKYFKKLIIFHLLIIFAFAEFEKDLQLKLILAEPGDTIKLDAGFFPILGTLSIEGKQNIVIKGSGISSTILNFSNQVEGAQGLSITNCNNIILEDFTVEEAKGDGIKCQYVNGITFRRIKTQWLGGPSSSNGAYGLYPVQCDNIMIEHCIAIGASDAGIYVGQSNNIIVRNCEVFQNVAGIEIENSIKADVHSNNVHNNTGGILVFDLPDLIQKDGKQIRIYDNVVKENNLDNFAPKGNIVAKVPAGTGIMIMATEHVEIFNNTIIDNKTAGTTVVSYFITEEKTKDTQYSPYTSAIYIYDNVYIRKPQLPTLANEIGILLFTHFFRSVPDIIYDGMPDPKYQNIDGTIPANRRLCLRNNSNARYLNLDLSLHFESWYSPFFADFKTDKKECDCALELLPEVKLSQIN